MEVWLKTQKPMAQDLYLYHVWEYSRSEYEYWAVKYEYAYIASEYKYLKFVLEYKYQVLQLCHLPPHPQSLAWQIVAPSTETRAMEAQYRLNLRFNSTQQVIFQFGFS